MSIQRVEKSGEKHCKGGIAGPVGPAIAVPLFRAMRNAGALFRRIIEPCPYIMR